MDGLGAMMSVRRMRRLRYSRARTGSLSRTKFTREPKAMTWRFIPWSAGASVGVAAALPNTTHVRALRVWADHVRRAK